MGTSTASLRALGAAWWLLCWMAAIIWPTVRSVSLQQQQQQQQQTPLYSYARTLRALQGHGAALPLYQELLRQNPNDRTAATWIASHPDTPQRHVRLEKSTQHVATKELQYITAHFLDWNFTPLGIADSIFGPETTSPSVPSAVAARISTAPLYLQPLRAGSPTLPNPKSALDTCIQLLLMAVCVPLATCQLHLGEKMVELLETMGIAYCDRDQSNQEAMMVPYCHIMPVKPIGTDQKTLYFATDLHPNVLSTTTIEKDHDPVMYIGPDSLALVDHWTSLQPGVKSSSKDNQNQCYRVVDIGTGSGIQALTMVASLQQSSKSHNTKQEHAAADQVVCIDINPRALQLARLNFSWNGFPEPVLILGDVTDEQGGGRLLLHHESFGETKPWQAWVGRPTMLLANPPFLPVPVHDPAISKRHGLFSSGGACGEVILKRIVELASQCLADDEQSVLGVVSEFMNPQTTFPFRLEKWWGNSLSIDNATTRGLLFTNEKPLDARTYASRRADSPQEFETWMQHLSKEEITHVSPGLLFLQKSSHLHDNDKDVVDGKRIHIKSYLVPTTDGGSIWTPTNVKARDFTRNKLIELGLHFDPKSVS